LTTSIPGFCGKFGVCIGIVPTRAVAPAPRIHRTRPCRSLDLHPGADGLPQALSQRYLAKPYPWWERGEIREIFRIALDRVSTARSALRAPEFVTLR
jgi:hypothetical protein